MKKVGKLCHSEYRQALADIQRADKYRMYLINFSTSKVKSISCVPSEIRNRHMHMKNAESQALFHSQLH